MSIENLNRGENFMKVAFWESVRHECKQMSSMAAISIMLSINFGKRVVLLDNGQDSNSLERIFTGIQRFYYVKEDSNYVLRHVGMDNILQNISDKSNLQPLLEQSAVEVIKDYLYYVPQSKVVNRFAYEYVLSYELNKIIESYDQLVDYTIIRARGGNNMSTKQVIDMADMVMVELSQNYGQLDEFFDHYASIRKHAIYVFNDYKANSISIYQIMERYRIKKEQVIVISEHMPLKAACLGGGLVDYIRSNTNCSSESENYRCVRELKRAAKIIIRKERSRWGATNSEID